MYVIRVLVLANVGCLLRLVIKLVFHVINPNVNIPEVVKSSNTMIQYNYIIPRSLDNIPRTSLNFFLQLFGKVAKRFWNRGLMTRCVSGELW